MSLTIIIAMSLASVAAVLVTASRVVGFQRLIKHATLVDVSVTVGAVFLFAGTITGVLVAVLTGLIMAVFLTTVRKLQSFAKPEKTSDPEFDEDGVWIYNKAPYV